MSFRILSLLVVLLILNPPSKYVKGILNETEYIQHFRNYDPWNYIGWVAAEKMTKQKTKVQLKRFCSEAHTAAGKGECICDVALFKETRLLTFDDPKYEERRIDVVEYGCQEGASPRYVKEYWRWYDHVIWFITEGQRPDCVYYLRLHNSSMREFRLDEHVCGIKL